MTDDYKTGGRRYLSSLRASRRRRKTRSILRQKTDKVHREREPEDVMNKKEEALYFRGGSRANNHLGVVVNHIQNGEATASDFKVGVRFGRRFKSYALDEVDMLKLQYAQTLTDNNITYRVQDILEMNARTVRKNIKDFKQKQAYDRFCRGPY